MHSTEHSHPLCSVFALVHEGPQWLMLTCPCIQTLDFLSPLQSLPVEIPVTKLFGHYRVQNSPAATYNSTTPKHWILKKSQRATTLKVTTLGQQRDVLFQYFQSIFTANPKFHLCFQLKTSSTAKLLPEALGTSERAEIWRRFSYRAQQLRGVKAVSACFPELNAPGRETQSQCEKQQIHTGKCRTKTLLLCHTTKALSCFIFQCLLIPIKWVAYLIYKIYIILYSLLYIIRYVRYNNISNMYYYI